MSLLIKALNKAEEAQAQNAKIEQTEKLKNAQPETGASNKAQTKTSQNSIKTASADLELSLSPTGSTFSEAVAKSATIADAPVAKSPAITTLINQSNSSQSNFSQSYPSQHVAAKNAANVFSAKGLVAKTDSARLVLIAGAGLIALLCMGLYFYQFVDNSPPINVSPRPLNQSSATPQATPMPIPEAAALKPPVENIALEAAPIEIANPTKPSVLEPTEPMLVAEKRENASNQNVSQQNASKKRAKVAAMVDEDAFSADENALDDNASENRSDQDSDDFVEIAAVTTPKQKTRKSKNNAGIASDSASIQVTRSTPQPSINPVLMRAYEAYNAGNDKDAIKLYKQVLQRDVRNVDALLGLGAIASRQGRSADANGWFGKVLELDPRNNIAKTALLNSDLQSNQPQGNEQANETSLKNMLAKQPNDANLHVALGNLYAEQNQWPAAQQAYFDAYSINKTADNAYNLAVSLDQMDKPKLALPYYLRALEQATDASNIDKAALQARISAIQ